MRKSLSILAFAAYAPLVLSQDAGREAVSQPPFTATFRIRFEAKVFREPDIRAEVLATIPVDTEVEVVGAAGHENNRTPAIFVEIIYGSQRGFITEAHFDTTDPRLKRTLQYMRGEHKLLQSPAKSGRTAEVHGSPSQATVATAQQIVGYRVVYFVRHPKGVIWMLTIYPKNVVDRFLGICC